MSPFGSSGVLFCFSTTHVFVTRSDLSALRVAKPVRLIGELLLRSATFTEL